MEEKLSNRPCGECRFHHRDYHYCQADKECRSIYPESPACENFAERTIAIGDQIRAMSDEELAEEIVFCFDKGDEVYWASPLIDGDYKTRQKALDATIEELKKEVNR